MDQWPLFLLSALLEKEIEDMDGRTPPISESVKSSGKVGKEEKPKFA
jgi:hypothetical protein